MIQNVSIKFFLYVCICLLIETNSECQGACSGHGRCTAYDMCICYRNWQVAINGIPLYVGALIKSNRFFREATVVSAFVSLVLHMSILLRFLFEKIIRI